jgi:hypothetical protein
MHYWLLLKFILRLIWRVRTISGEFRLERKPFDDHGGITITRLKGFRAGKAAGNKTGGSRMVERKGFIGMIIWIKRFVL